MRRSLFRAFLAATSAVLSASLLVSCTPATPVPTPTPTAAAAPTSTPTPAASGSCDLTAGLDAVNPVTVYTRPSAAADAFGELGSGETVHATAKTADGFYGFDPGVAQAGNVGIFRLRWVLKTADVSLSSGCASLPTVVGPIAGICYAMMMQDTPIYSSPDNTSALVTTMHMNDYAMVTAHDPGWYTLDLNVASPSTDSLGYLEEGQLGGFNGPCEGL
jgi:hypothetical protein